MSRLGSKRSIAPIRPSSPYETRSFSSTCAGRPLPSRPATYLTSGAYVRISRSRTAWSSLFFTYSRQRAWVSSCATVRGYDLRRRFPQISDREAQHPERNRTCCDDQDHEALVAVHGLRGRSGDPDERDREDEEERSERRSGRRRGHAETLEGPRLESLAQPL